jgi:hypothetical protein
MLKDTGTELEEFFCSCKGVGGKKGILNDDAMDR